MVTILSLAACASTAPTTREPAARAAPYPGRCELVAIEYVEVERRTETLPEPGAVLLVASYRPSGRPSRSPFDVRFRVEQHGAEALRMHLESHPIVACRPAGAGEASRVEVPSLGDGAPPVGEPRPAPQPPR